MSIISNISLIGLMLTNNISLTINKLNKPTNYDPLNIVENNIRLANSIKEEFTYENEISQSRYSTNSATVTVLTHGMAGSYLDWLTFSNDSFDTDSSYILPFKLNSLINFQEREEDSVNKTNIFRFKYENNSTILDRLIRKDNKYIFNVNETITEEDVQSHIILIYDGDLGSQSRIKTNLECYNDFKESLATILVGISKYQDDYLPKINLIGQSRGGLVNLEYAINHPNIVSNLISLGTPYSDGDHKDLALIESKYKTYIYDEWASFYNILLSATNSDLNPTGYDDMLNNFNLKNDFNGCKESLKSYAIGFNQTYQYFINTIANILTGYTNFLDNLAQKLSNYTSNFISKDGFKTIIDDLINSINNYLLKELILTNCAYTYGVNKFTELIYKLCNNDELQKKSENASKLFRMLYSIIDYDIFCRNENDDSIIQSDICVNLDSQLGLTRQKNIYNYLNSEIDNNNYQFTKRSIITLGDENNNYYYLQKYTAQNNYWVGHNFENKNPTAVKLISEHLNSNNDLHQHKFEWNYTSSDHSKLCECGTYNYTSENHKFDYNCLNSTSHSLRCKVCGYQSNKNHNFKYNQVGGINSHKKICLECGYSEHETHLYSLYKIDVDLNYHTSMCKCGLEGTKQKHVINRLSGSCSKCNYEILKPVSPIIPFNPIN